MELWRSFGRINVSLRNDDQLYNHRVMYVSHFNAMLDLLYVHWPIGHRQQRTPYPYCLWDHDLVL